MSRSVTEMVLALVDYAEDRDLIDPVYRLYISDKINTAEPHKRLSAGDFDPAYSQSCSSPADALYLLISQYLSHGDLLTSFRHAIPAPEVAPVGDGDTHIIDFSAVSVFHYQNVKSPLLPPVFSTRWMSLITIRLSIALHIS